MPLHFEHDAVILDASCIISLYASGKMEGVLRAVSHSVAVAAYVAIEEALWVYTNTAAGRERIKLQPFVEAGLLKIVDVETEQEAESVVSLTAQRLDRGEAITGAIALHREWTLVTDDRKARAVIGQRAQHLQLLFTLELVKHWSDLNAIRPNDLSVTLQNVRRLGFYTPHKQHPLYQWWHAHGGG